MIKFLIYLIAIQAAGNTPEMKRNYKKRYFLILFCIETYEAIYFKHAVSILHDFWSDLLIFLFLCLWNSNLPSFLDHAVQNIPYHILVRGGVTKKNGKIWDNVPIRVDPPPSDIWDIFEFETFLKNADPPPPIDLRHFWNWDYFDVGWPPGQAYKLAYLHQKRLNFIEKDQN